MSINAYRASLRSAVRGYWSGVLSREQFTGEMRTAINRRLSEAFEEGAAECGIGPDEFTEAEFLALGQATQEELSHIGDLADRVEANSKESGGKLGPLLNRVSTMWLNRYRDLRNRGKTMACADQKLMWKLGATEEHCSTCPRLDGKVKRGSQWEVANIRPQNPPNPSIECGGWRCLCELVPTDEPVSKGPLPRFR